MVVGAGFEPALDLRPRIMSPVLKPLSHPTRGCCALRYLVGTAGFEPALSGPPDRRIDQAFLRPVWSVLGGGECRQLQVLGGGRQDLFDCFLHVLLSSM